MSIIQLGYELAVITDYALNIEKFREIVSKKSHVALINGYPRTLRNTNGLLRECRRG